MMINTLNEDLIRAGFIYEEHCVASFGRPGYEKVFSHGDGLYDLWIAVDLGSNKLYLYNEYECGGLLWNTEQDIPYVENLLEWIKTEIGELLNEY